MSCKQAMMCLKYPTWNAGTDNFTCPKCPTQSAIFSPQVWQGSSLFEVPYMRETSASPSRSRKCTYHTPVQGSILSWLTIRPTERVQITSRDLKHPLSDEIRRVHASKLEVLDAFRDLVDHHSLPHLENFPSCCSERATCQRRFRAFNLSRRSLSSSKRTRWSVLLDSMERLDLIFANSKIDVAWLETTG